jgi:hypothetical protein
VSPRSSAVLAVIGGLLTGAAAVVGADLAGYVLPWPVGLPAGLAAGALTAVDVVCLRTDAADLEPPVTERAAPVSPLADFGALHQTVQSAGRDADRFEFRVRPRLCALAAERLWQWHGLDWRSAEHRAAARAVVGPGTWALLTAPPHSLACTPDALERWLDELETL